jgi:hypothetical protein
VTLTAKNGTLLAPITPADTPLQTVLILGRFGEAATRGECGETNFTAADCRINTAATTVTCQQ